MFPGRPVWLLAGALALCAGCAAASWIQGEEPTKPKKKPQVVAGRPEELATYEPATIRIHRRAAGPTTSWRVRVYGDEDYRLGNARWQEHIRMLVGDASDVLEAGLGAKLVIESIRPWPRKSSKENLEKVIEELRKADPGNDVDWVIGCVSPLGVLTNSIHELGMANLLGKHFVVRGTDDRTEAAALAKHFREIDAEERDEFLIRRRRHKELVVFLHEWLHNLGAVHHADREILLHPSYDHLQQSLDRENAQVVTLALEARGAAGPQGRPDYRALAGYLAATPAPSWYTGDREQLITFLSAQSPRPEPPATSAPASAPVKPELAPAVTGDLQPLRRAVEESRWDAAIAGCLEAKPAGAATAAWSEQVADLCARAGLIARAEHLAMGAQGAARARQAIESARLRFGVRPGRAELSPAEEAERARVWFAARTALDSDQLARAEADLKKALQRFGDDAGLLALRCETAVRRSSIGRDSSGACERAVKLWEDLPRALFWSALAQANEGNRKLAVERLQRSKKMDPTFDGPWKVLADIYRFEGRRSDLASLRTEYEIQFGKPMR